VATPAPTAGPGLPVTGAPADLPQTAAAGGLLSLIGGFALAAERRRNRKVLRRRQAES
jgi:hypothetical protein